LHASGIQSVLSERNDLEPPIAHVQDGLERSGVQPGTTKDAIILARARGSGTCKGDRRAQHNGGEREKEKKNCEKN
jgi:hypothetical protein